MGETNLNDSNVKVAVRVRPMNRREKELNTKCVVEMEGNQTFLHPASGNLGKADSSAQTKGEVEQVLNLEVNGGAACCLHTRDSLIAAEFMSYSAELLALWTPPCSPDASNGIVHMGKTLLLSYSLIHIY
ncbi:hypothetical protein SRHO_G00138600 [Serrasalmus rhombeus]